VAALQSLPNLLEALGGDADSIQYYSENRVVFGRRTQNNTREAILSMPLGSIMIVWQGSGPGRLGNAQVYAHNYSLYLRAPEIEDVGYEDICDWIVNDVSGWRQPQDAAHPHRSELRADGFPTSQLAT